jgi:hypothetical protein
MKRSFFYAGVFLICASVTALQILETRLLSVASYYYLAFLSISMAMFGMTAGAVWVYRSKAFSRETLPGDLALYASRYCLAVGACLLLQMSIPLATVASAMMFCLWLELALVLAVPFFFAGVVVTLALTRSQFPVGEVYATDLIGASLGCLGALGLLQVLDAPSAILVLAAIAAVGASFFARSAVVSQLRPGNGTARIGRSLVALAGVLCAVAFLNAGTVHGLQPVIVKGAIDSRNDVEYEKWNSYSRIHVGYPVKAPPMLWSSSDRVPSGIRVWERPLDIDGSAYTNMFEFDGKPEDVSFLKYDVTNVAYAVRNTGRAAIIGVGGGRDVLSAWLFGFRDITGVELNPIFIDLLTRREPFAAFAGLSGHPGVQFHVDEARSWFARTQERFDLIQMSMIDTWAATGAGAYTLSENGLYTVEGWRHFVDALTPTGIFTVSRWYGTGSIGEAGRMVSLAARVLMDAGVSDPESHLALVANRNLATLILSRQPLSAADLTALHRVADEMNFEVVLAPDTTPGSALLGRIAKARDPIELAGITAGLPFDLTPPHDDRPFFFNQLPLTSIWKLGFDVQRFAPGGGVIFGNSVASLTLLLILLIAALLVTAVIIVPLRSAIHDTNRRLAIAGSAYFLFLGIGFMFVEISLLQRFSLFLGHPVYSLSIALFAMVLSTGVGSLLSERLRLSTQTHFVIWAALLAVYLACLPQGLPGMLTALESSGILVRGATVVAVIMPAGLLMGFGFPTGMRIVLQQNPRPAPWFWGINGAAGVLGSILAVAVGITFGISASLDCGAFCYAALVPAAFMLRPKARTAPAITAASEAD